MTKEMEFLGCVAEFVRKKWGLLEVDKEFLNIVDKYQETGVVSKPNGIPDGGLSLCLHEEFNFLQPNISYKYVESVIPKTEHSGRLLKFLQEEQLQTNNN